MATNCHAGQHRIDNGGDWIFLAELFAGLGVIEGVSVRCLSREAQVPCHAQGYTPTEKDFRDVELLREEFGIEVPPLLQRRQAGADSGQDAG